jgi:hypothetical protein
LDKDGHEATPAKNVFTGVNTEVMPASLVVLNQTVKIKI